MVFKMKKLFYLFIVFFIFSACSKKTYIPEEIYYTVENNAKIAKREQIKAKREKQNQAVTTNQNYQGYLDEKTINAIIAEGEKFIGTPYKWGGTTPEAFDCSGFITYIFNKQGIKLYGNAVVLGNQVERIDKNKIKKGDLVFFKGSDLKSLEIGHVALVTEVSGSDFNMIHATTSKGVIINSFFQYEYWKNRLLFVGRVKN